VLLATSSRDEAFYATAASAWAITCTEPLRTVAPRAVRGFRGDLKGDQLNDERRLMLRVLSQIAAGLVFTSALGSIRGNGTAESQQGTPRHTQQTMPRFKTRKFQVGKASWYGRPFQHRQTASGEPYDMYQFTAAHRTLPLGSWVKVTDLKNDRSVIVRINDRGPAPNNRIIDLSYNAAKMLDMTKSGVHPVRLDLIERPTISENEDRSKPVLTRVEQP
jgi:rare lipoprotein A